MMIDGVQKIWLKRIADDRGYVTEILRADSPYFKQFGQIYISMCRGGVIKAWHCHQKQTDYFFVLKGTAKIGLYDGREDSPTYGQYETHILGEEGDNALLIIPPLVWHGQMALSETSLLLNIPTEAYNYQSPDELRKGVGELEDIWTIKNR